jgi:hypothetical protein
MKTIRGVALSLAVPLGGTFAGRTRSTTAPERARCEGPGDCPGASIGAATTARARA